MLVFSSFFPKPCISVASLVWLRSSRNVLRKTKLHLTFCRHDGKQMMTEFSFFGWIPPSTKIPWCIRCEDLTHLYVAAQGHGRVDHGEVNSFDLADSRSVVGLNDTRSRWHELDHNHKTIRIQSTRGPTGTKINPRDTQLLTLYEPMALIWVKMAILTWSHGTPTNLGAESIKHITDSVCRSCICIYRHFFSFWFILSCISSTFTLAKGTRLANAQREIDEVLPDDPAEGVCHVGGFPTRDDAHPNKESAGCNQHPHSHNEVCVSVQSSHRNVWTVRQLWFYMNTAQEGANLEDHWLVMWTRGEVICVTLWHEVLGIFHTGRDGFPAEASGNLDRILYMSVLSDINTTTNYYSVSYMFYCVPVQ